jgi:hypothetical protein
LVRKHTLHLEDEGADRRDLWFHCGLLSASGSFTSEGRLSSNCLLERHVARTGRK